LSSINIKKRDVTPVLKVSRIFNTYVITDTGYINHTMRKYNISRDLESSQSYITLFMHSQSNETSTNGSIMIHVAK